MATLKEVHAAERDRLAKSMADVQTKMQALTTELDGYRREVRALDAYDNATQDKATKQDGTRTARGSRSQTLLGLIGTSEAGLTRAQILEHLSAKGNKAEEGAISNALTTMKKGGKLKLDTGIYTVA